MQYSLLKKCRKNNLSRQSQPPKHRTLPRKNFVLVCSEELESRGGGDTKAKLLAFMHRGCIVFT